MSGDLKCFPGFVGWSHGECADVVTSQGENRRRSPLSSASHVARGEAGSMSRKLSSKGNREIEASRASASNIATDGRRLSKCVSSPGQETRAHQL